MLDVFPGGPCPQDKVPGVNQPGDSGALKRSMFLGSLVLAQIHSRPKMSLQMASPKPRSNNPRLSDSRRIKVWYKKLHLHLTSGTPGENALRKQIRNQPNVFSHRTGSLGLSENCDLTGNVSLTCKMPYLLIISRSFNVFLITNL